MRRLIAMFCCALISGHVLATADDAVTETDLAVLRAALTDFCGMPFGDYTVFSDEPSEMDPNKRVTVFGMTFHWRDASGVHWPRTEICKGMRMGSGNQVHAAWNDDDFGKVFPGSRGYAEASLPVYSDDGKRAVIYAMHSCGALCGAGLYYEIRKTDNGWQVTSKQMSWIS